MFTSRDTSRIFIIIAAVILVLSLGFLLFAWKTNLLDGTITYVVDGDPYKEVKLVRTKKYTTPTPTEKGGYDFDGWYYDDGTFAERFSLDDLPQWYLVKKTTVYGRYVEHEHNFAWQVIEQPTCQKTGIKAEKCTIGACDAVIQTESIAKIEHTVNNGALILNVTDEGEKEFSYTGKCSSCNTVLDMDGITPTEKIHSVESCLTEGKYEYTYEAYGKNITYTHIVEKLPHTLNGKFITENENLLSPDCILFGTPGTYLDDDRENEHLLCGESAPGRYICESCYRNIQIEIKRLHNEVYDVKKAPTCFDTGICDVYCADSDCKMLLEENKILDKLQHIPVQKLERDKVTGAVRLSDYCSREECGHLIKFISLTENDYTVTDPTEATCLNEGVRKFTYKKDTKLFFTETTPITEHKIGGVFHSLALDEQGRLHSNVPGVEFFTNVGKPTCGNTVDGYYKCDVCYEVTGLPVLVPVYKEHAFETPVITKHESCTETGSHTKYCPDCKLTLTETRPIIPHSYVWTLTVNNVENPNLAQNDIYCISGVCSVCGDEKSWSYDKGQIDEISSLTAKDKITKYPECDKEGILSFTYIDTNVKFGDFIYMVNAKYDFPIPQTNKHTLVKGKTIESFANSDGTINYSVGGIYLMANGYQGDPKCSYDRVQDKWIPVNGYAICYDCGGTVLLSVIVDHYAPEDKFTVTKNPTCVEPGVKSAICVDCKDDFTRPIPATGNHVNTYKLVEKSSKNDGVFDSFDVVLGCHTCNTINETVKTISKSVADYEVVSIGNCCEKGIGRFTYSYMGNELSYDIELDGPHFLCGVSAESLKNKDGLFLSTQVGISLSEDVSNFNDGDKVEGGYVCQICKEFIVVEVLVVVDDEE